MQKNAFRSSMFGVRRSAFDVFCRLNRGAGRKRTTAKKSRSRLRAGARAL